MAESNMFWDQLLELIGEGRIIPVVGQDLLTLPASAGSNLLYPYMAGRLARYLGVSADGLPQGAEINEVACRYIAKGKPAQKVYAALKTIAAEAEESLPVPEPLLQLAAIRPFQLFVTTTFDSCLARALNHQRFGDQPKTCVLTHAPNEVQDLPADLKSIAGPVVYHLMGRVSATPAYVVTQEDLVEYFHSLQSEATRPSLLFDELSRRSLLILGCRFSGWFNGFFMRMTKRQRLSTSDTTDYVADDVVSADESLVLFLERFSSGTEIVRETSAVEFVRELHERWTSKHPATAPAPAPEPGPVLDGAGPVPGTVFLSYASEDRTAVEKIAEALISSGVDTFFDRQRLQAGDDWETKLRRGIRQCSLFVPVISSNSLGPDPFRFLRDEWREALVKLKQVPFSGEGNFLLPVVIDDTATTHPELPLEFTTVQWHTLPDGQPTPVFVDRVKALYRKYQLARRVTA